MPPVFDQRQGLEPRREVGELRRLYKKEPVAALVLESQEIFRKLASLMPRLEIIDLVMDTEYRSGRKEEADALDMTELQSLDSIRVPTMYPAAEVDRLSSTALPISRLPRQCKSHPWRHQCA